MFNPTEGSKTCSIAQEKAKMRQQHDRRSLHTTFKPVHTQLLHTPTEENNGDSSRNVKEDHDDDESQEYIFSDETEICNEPLNEDEEFDSSNIYYGKYSHRTSLSGANMNNIYEVMVSDESDESEELHELPKIFQSPNNLLLKLAMLIHATNMNKKNTDQLLHIVQDLSKL